MPNISLLALGTPLFFGGGGEMTFAAPPHPEKSLGLVCCFTESNIKGGCTEDM